MSGDLSGFSMMELFRMEAESHTATLSAGLVALEGSSAAPEVIEPLMRAAHSLKGAARIVGLDAAVRVAHAMEDCFVAAQKGKLVLQPEHVDILLQGVDLLVQIAQIDEPEIEAGNRSTPPLIDALVADLAAVQGGKRVSTRRFLHRPAMRRCLAPDDLAVYLPTSSSTLDTRQIQAPVEAAGEGTPHEQTVQLDVSSPISLHGPRWTIKVVSSLTASRDCQSRP